MPNKIHIEKLNTNVAVTAASEFRDYAKARPIADKIGLCPKTIRRWANKGFIKRFKLSDRISLYDEKEVHDFIQSSLK